MSCIICRIELPHDACCKCIKKFVSSRGSVPLRARAFRKLELGLGKQAVLATQCIHTKMVEAIVGAAFQSTFHMLMEKRACLSKVHDSMMPALSAPRRFEIVHRVIEASECSQATR
jgi:hypothetical protein